MWRNRESKWLVCCCCWQHAFLDVMLPCCMDSNLKKKKNLCQLAFQRCASFFSFFFASTCIGQTKKSHVAKPWVEMARLLLLFVVGNTLFFDVMLPCGMDSTVSIWIEMALLFVGRFCKWTHKCYMCRKHCVVQKLKMYVDARMSARFLCMCICMRCARVYVCMCACVSSICAIRKQVWWRFNCLNLAVLQNIEWPVIECCWQRVKRTSRINKMRPYLLSNGGKCTLRCRFFCYCADCPFSSKKAQYQ